jgi:hypothetical protein
MTDEWDVIEPEEPDNVTDKQLGQLIDEWLADARPERYDEDDKDWMDPVIKKARKALLQYRTTDQAITDAAKRRVREREGQAVKRTHNELRKIAEHGALPLGWGDGDDWKKLFAELLHLPLKIGGQRVRLGVASPTDLDQWQIENLREQDDDQLRRINARKGARMLAEWEIAQQVRRVEDLRPGGGAA